MTKVATVEIWMTAEDAVFYLGMLAKLGKQSDFENYYMQIYPDTKIDDVRRCYVVAAALHA